MCKAPELAPPAPERSTYNLCAAARLEASRKSARAERLERLHDRANIGALGVIFCCALSSLRGGAPGHLATTYASLAYLAVDLGLVAACPDMFKSPGPIAMHHVVTIALHWHPIAEPDHAEYASMALLVELNTLVLTLRRLLDYPAALEPVFWGTWVFLRLVWSARRRLLLSGTSFRRRERERKKGTRASRGA